MTAKQIVTRVVEQLPDDCTDEDIVKALSDLCQRLTAEEMGRRGDICSWEELQSRRPR